MSELLKPLSAPNGLELRNRVCMGSMTRNRCVEDNMPTEATAEYYAARARNGAGLIVAEGTFIYLNGAEWPYAPVMYTKEHAASWKVVTDRVHEVGGKIFFQPWHPGRIQNEGMPMLKNNPYPVYAPSAIPAKGGKFRLLEGKPGHTHNITEIQDVTSIIEQYRNSVALAKEAGFDGIELLSQGGYLLHNFLASFPLEVLDAILTVWDADRVGIKICPSDDYNDSAVSFNEQLETYEFFIKEAMKRRLMFINLSRRGCHLGRDQDDYFKSADRPSGLEIPVDYEPLQYFGKMIKSEGSPTLLMVNHEYSVSEADDLMRDGKIDIVCFGRPFIYNPDLMSRIREDQPFAINDRGGAVNYGPYEDVNENYNDWPLFNAQTIGGA